MRVAEGEDTHDAVGGACGEGELLVRAVVPVQQICARQITASSRSSGSPHRRNNQGREEKEQEEIRCTSGLLADVGVESRSHGGVAESGRSDGGEARAGLREGDRNGNGSGSVGWRRAEATATS